MIKITTNSMYAEMSKKDGIERTVEIKTKGIGVWDDEQSIEAGLTASGTIIVHECKEIFMRADELGEIMHIKSNSGVEYVYIKFLNRERGILVLNS